MVWSGWDPDAPKSNHGMTMKSPVVPGVTRVIRDELVNGTRGPQAASAALVQERLLLAEDAAHYVKTAKSESIARLFHR
jgi:hypothetical protein